MMNQEEQTGGNSEIQSSSIIKNKPKRKRQEKKASEVVSEIDTTIDEENATDTSIPGLIELGDGEDEWAVEKVIGKRVVKGVVQYKVKWLGWKSSYNSWEPKRHLENSKDAVKKFEKQLAQEIKERKKKPVTSPPSAAKTKRINDQKAQEVFVKPEVTDEKKINGDSGFEVQLQESGKLSAPTVNELAKQFSQHVLNGEKTETGESGWVSDTDELDPDVEELYVIESEEDDDDENDPDFIQSEMFRWGESYPMVRRKWRCDETPLYILGSAYIQDELYHLVRLQTPEDADDVLENPYKGVTKDNAVLVASKVFRFAYPTMLIKYYQSRRMSFQNAKRENELAEDAARNSMHSHFKRVGYKTNYNRMLEDNMPPDQRVSEEQLCKYDHVHISKKKRYSTDENEDVLNHNSKDDFGLPLSYGNEVDEDIEGEEDSTDSDSEATHWKEVEINPRKVPRIKNRPKYDLVWTRPFPNLPGIDRLRYRRVYE